MARPKHCHRQAGNHVEDPEDPEEPEERPRKARAITVIFPLSTSPGHLLLPYSVNGTVSSVKVEA